jgi:hypothetical protein
MILRFIKSPLMVVGQRQIVLQERVIGDKFESLEKVLQGLTGLVPGKVPLAQITGGSAFLLPESFIGGATRKKKCQGQYHA